MREHQVGGRKLVDQLARDGFPLTAAFWAKLDDEGRWYLRIVSPVVGADGPFEAYRRIRQAVGACRWDDPLEMVTTSDIKVLNPSHPLAREIAEVIGRYRVPPLDTWYRDMLIYSAAPTPQPAGS